MKLEIITAISRIVVIIFTGVLFPLLKEWISTRTENSKWSQLKEYAVTAVWAAEQIYNKAEKADPDGKLRKNYAMQAIAIMADRLGLTLTEAEIKTLVESAVTDINYIKAQEGKNES